MFVKNAHLTWTIGNRRQSLGKAEKEEKEACSFIFVSALMGFKYIFLYSEHTFAHLFFNYDNETVAVLINNSGIFFVYMKNR